MSAPFQIVRYCGGYLVAELQGDQTLMPFNTDPIVSREAAERLRDDLAADMCELHQTSPTDRHDPGEHMASCYDIAAQIVPLLPDSPDPWPLAVRIADAQPWRIPARDCDQLPF